jgi:hypothetical protein
MTKLLVGLGHRNQSKKTSSIEVINLESILSQSQNNLEFISNKFRINFEANNNKCKDFPDFPNVSEGPIGGLDLQGRPIICGGDQKVYLFENSLLFLP